MYEMPLKGCTDGERGEERHIMERYDHPTAFVCTCIWCQKWEYAISHLLHIMTVYDDLFILTKGWTLQYHVDLSDETLNTVTMIVIV